MKKKVMIIFCLVWILLEAYLIVHNYLNESPVATNVVLLIGFLGVLYLISGNENMKSKNR